MKSPMSSSLHVGSNAATPSKKQSVVSTNKPNCSGSKADEKTKVMPTSLGDPNTNIVVGTQEQQGDNECTQKMPKREKTPDIISGAVIQKTDEHDMKPQVMEDDRPKTDYMNINHNKTNDVPCDIKNNDATKQNTVVETTDSEQKMDSRDEEHPTLEHTPAKHIITNEEEAKAKFAAKRKEMKEKMEREAEIERQRLVGLSYMNSLLKYFKYY